MKKRTEIKFNHLPVIGIGTHHYEKDIELMNNIIGSYLKEAPMHYENFISAKENSDWPGVQKSIKPLKSIAKILGAHKLAKICDQIEANPSNFFRKINDQELKYILIQFRQLFKLSNEELDLIRSEKIENLEINN